MSFMFKPFRGTYYNHKFFKDLNKVACPPYDVITGKALLKLRANSKYNFSWVDLADDGDYRRAADTLKSWYGDKIMVDDDAENFYLYGQKFKVEGKTLWRFGVMGALKIDKEGAIKPHEYTHSKAKEDRARLMRAAMANLSPVFVISPKKINVLGSLYKKVRKQKPFFTFDEPDGTATYMWKITDKAVQGRISAALENNYFIIADGHHRFEVSYDFFKEYAGKVGDCDYVMAYMVDAQPGLVILPINRIVDMPCSREELLAKLGGYFSVKPVTQKVLTAKLKSRSGFMFGICVDGGFYLARLKKPAVLDKIVKDKVFRRLDTYVLANFVYPLLGIEKPCAYANNISQAKEMAAGGKAAFLMRPACMKTICDIVGSGLRMPQKSTYFHPKIGSGLVIRKLVP